jgi:hypothetical protein
MLSYPLPDTILLVHYSNSERGTHQLPPFATVVFHVSSVKPSPTVTMGAAATRELHHPASAKSASAGAVAGENRIEER